MEDEIVVSLPAKAVVAEDFEGETNEELTLTEGTTVIVSKIDDDGWWTIESKERHGIFPGSYLDITEEIELPCRAKVQKPFPDMGLTVGTVIQVSEITSMGWKIQWGSKVGMCSWKYLEFTEEPLTPIPQPAAAPAVAGGVANIQRPPTRSGSSAGLGGGAAPGGGPSGSSPRGPGGPGGGGGGPSGPSPRGPGGPAAAAGGVGGGPKPGPQIQKPGQPQQQQQQQHAQQQQPLQKQPSQSGSGPKPLNPAQKFQQQQQQEGGSSSRPQSAPPTNVAALKNEAQQKSEAEKADSNRPKSALYKRESVFAGRKSYAPGERLFTGEEAPDQIEDIAKRKKEQGYNPYLLHQEKQRQVEQEGRWEFLAFSELPPPPPFENLEKNYFSGQMASFIDWKAKERSAQFDI